MFWIGTTNDKIYAGSNDARVSVNLAHTLKRTHFLSPLYALSTQTRIVSGHPYVLDWDHNHFRIWRQQLRELSVEELLFEFKLKNTHTLTSASLSADGNFVAVADQIKGRIWCVQYNEVKELECPIAKGCQTVAFHNKRNELLMGFKSCAKVLDPSSGKQKGTTLNFEEASRVIWVGDYICVFSQKQAILYKDANVVFTAPSYPQNPVAAAMHDNLFAIGYASGHVRVFDLKTRLLISWSKENERRFEFTRLMTRIKTAMTKLSFNGNGKGLLLGNPDWVTVMSLEKPLPSATIDLPKHTKKKRSLSVLTSFDFDTVLRLDLRSTETLCFDPRRAFNIWSADIRTRRNGGRLNLPLKSKICWFNSYISLSFFLTRDLKSYDSSITLSIFWWSSLHKS